MELHLGFSPCPNDTFIFDAMLHGKIDTEGITFIPVIEDVETLNQKALQQELAITKLSYHAFAHLVDKYILLDAGSALGFGVGPLLISKNKIENISEKIADLKIGIPGKLTTANFLLNIAFPQAQQKVEMVFSDIENALINEEIDLGLIIHENRFTYAAKGLHKVIDLGSFWEQKTGSAIPLGGIVMSRKYDKETINKVNRIMASSVEFAMKNPLSSAEFVKQHAQEMEESVMVKHIQLYVNKYSLNLGLEGRKAVSTLLESAVAQGLILPLTNNIFID
jgi:1,4-dihydroxy-6-naphthoate synthase